MIEEIKRIRVCVGEKLRERSLGHVWKVTNIFLCSGGSDACKCFLVGCSENVEDLVELIDVISPLEERTSTKEFGKDTSYGPNIDWKC